MRPGPSPTNQVFRSFVAEMCARHVHWVAVQDLVGNGAAVQLLSPTALAFAAHEYFTQLTGVFRRCGDQPAGPQTGLPAAVEVVSSLRRTVLQRRCDENFRTRAHLAGAAAVCANGAVSPSPSNPLGEGLFTLRKDLSLTAQHQQVLRLARPRPGY
jgi:hypothetical protein